MIKRLIIVFVIFLIGCQIASAVNGAYYITSKPDGAQVTIDGVLQGITPVTVMASSGIYVVEITSQKGIYRDSFIFTENVEKIFFVDLTTGQTSFSGVDDQVKIILPKNGQIFSYLFYTEANNSVEYPVSVNRELASCHSSVEFVTCSVDGSDAIIQMVYNGSEVMDILNADVVFEATNGYSAEVKMEVRVIDLNVVKRVAVLMAVVIIMIWLIKREWS